MTKQTYSLGFNGHAIGGQSKCYHGGHKALWTLPNGSPVYAAQEAELTRQQYGVVLDCTGFLNRMDPTKRAEYKARQVREALLFDVGADKYAALLDEVQKPTPRISVDWPDGGEPPLAPAFWARLLETLDGSLCVCCIGSHGRTGTALAALYMAQHGSFDADATLTLAEVVRTVRAKHCVNAIETRDQIEYLEDVADYYGVIVTDEFIEGSYAYRAPVNVATTPLASDVPRAVGNAITSADISAATRAIVNGRDAATGIPTTANVAVGNAKSRKAAKRKARRDGDIV